MVDAKSPISPTTMRRSTSLAVSWQVETKRTGPELVFSNFMMWLKPIDRHDQERNHERHSAEHLTISATHTHCGTESLGSLGTR